MSLGNDLDEIGKLLSFRFWPLDHHQTIDSFDQPLGLWTSLHDACRDFTLAVPDRTLDFVNQ